MVGGTYRPHIIFCGDENYDQTQTRAEADASKEVRGDGDASARE